MAKLKTGRHTSALKATRQNEKRRWANKSRKDEAKNITKQLLEALARKDATASKDLLKKTVSIWTRIGRSNVVHHAAASRKIARLSRAVHRLTAASR